MNERILITVDGRILSAEKGVLISEAVNGEKPCGGHGKCGKCRVIAKGELSNPTADELNLLSKEELDAGIRLACMTRAFGDCEIVTRSQILSSQIITEGDLPELSLKPAFRQYGIAIDIGTTTLAARLYGTNGDLLASTSRLNPQGVWGADVISRIESALAGRSSELAGLVRAAIDEIILTLTSTANIGAKEVDGVVITGNTVMLSLLTEQSVEPFSHAPFRAQRLFGELLVAGELELSSLSPDVPAYLPPCISAFVGADTTSAIIATELMNVDAAMLADVGTNGEIALVYGGELTVCSTAAGPAFEGVGISMGMRGSDGAIDKVAVEDGELKTHVIGEAKPIGICGSGLVDAVACMLELGILDGSGYLEDDVFAVQAPVSLTPKDIRMLQLAKSAICAGILTLIESAGLTVHDIPRLYIAGGFGNYLNTESAARIGLLPCEIAQKAKAVGNAALTGASVLLLDVDAREKAAELAKSAKTLDLSTSRTFSDKYMSGMMLEEV